MRRFELSVNQTKTPTKLLLQVQWSRRKSALGQKMQVAQFRGLLVHWRQAGRSPSRHRRWSMMETSGQNVNWMVSIRDRRARKAHLLLKNRNYCYLLGRYETSGILRPAPCCRMVAIAPARSGLLATGYLYYIGCQYGVEGQIWERPSLG